LHFSAPAEAVGSTPGGPSCGAHSGGVAHQLQLRSTFAPVAPGESGRPTGRGSIPPLAFSNLAEIVGPMRGKGRGRLPGPRIHVKQPGIPIQDVFPCSSGATSSRRQSLVRESIACLAGASTARCQRAEGLRQLRIIERRAASWRKWVEKRSEPSFRL